MKLKTLFIPLYLFLSTTVALSSALPAAGLKGTYFNQPERLKKKSPLIGAIVAENGTIPKILATKQEEDTPLSKLAKLLFHELDTKARRTVRPSNPVSVLSFPMIRILLSLLDTPKSSFGSLLPTSVVFPEKGRSTTLTHFGLDWWNSYFAWQNGLSDGYKRDNFKTHGKRFLKVLDEAKAYDADKTRDLLLAFAYLGCHNPQDIHAFFRLFNRTFTASLFTEEDFQQYEHTFMQTLVDEKSMQESIEKIVFWLIRRKSGSLYFLRPRLQSITHNGSSVPLCVEGTIQAIINLMLYDPTTGKLTIEKIPPSLLINPLFKTYIEKHNEVHKQSYYQDALPDWAKLMREIPGITYNRDTVELLANPSSILAVLNFLFGTKVETFESLGRSLSSDQRLIVFSDVEEEGHLSETDSDSDEENLYTALASDSESTDPDANNVEENETETSEWETFSEASEPNNSPETSRPQSAQSSESDSERGAREETDLQEEEKETIKKHTIIMKVEDTQIETYRPLVKIKTELGVGKNQVTENEITTTKINYFGHAQLIFEGKSSRIPTLACLNNLVLAEKIIGQKLVPLFDIDWYRTLVANFKNKTIKTGPELLAFLQKHSATPEQIAAPSDDDDYLLEDAINRNRLDLVKALLDFGVPASFYPNDDYIYASPLRDAFSTKYNALPIIQLLQEHGASLTREAINDATYKPLIHLWFDSKYVDEKPFPEETYLPEITLLLEWGADPNSVDTYTNWPLLKKAIDANAYELAKLLLEKGANPDGTNPFDKIPLLFIAMIKQDPFQAERFTKLLLSHGATHFEKSELHDSALQLALKIKNPAIVGLLLEYGADPREYIEVPSIQENGEEGAPEVLAVYLYANIIALHNPENQALQECARILIDFVDKEDRRIFAATSKRS